MTPMATKTRDEIQLSSFPSSSHAGQHLSTTSSVMKTPNCYSIFRNPSDRKTVHIIRHGESVYNAIDR